MLTKSTGMLVVLANRINADVHSFTCHQPIESHVPQPAFDFTQKQKGMVSAF